MFNRINFKILLVIPLVILFFFSFNLTARAQGVGISISPTKTEATVDPGEVLNASIKVKNDSDSAKTMYAYLKDFTAGSETGIANLIPPGSEPGPYLSSWINITGQAIEFSPHEEKIIPFTITVPAESGPGGYYGAVVFGTEPPKLNTVDGDKGAAMSISQQTASLVLLTVSGDIIEDASIREFSTDKKFYTMPFSVKFLSRIENTGNVHVKPRGQIAVKNMFGKEILVMPFNDKASNVLPKSIRRFEDIYEGKRGFGKYTASLSLSYGTTPDQGGQGKQTIYQEKEFWIIPWKFIIPGVLALIFLIALVSLLLKFYKNKAVKRAMQDMGLTQVRYIKKSYGPSFTLHLTLIITVLLLLIFLIGVIFYFIFFA